MEKKLIILTGNDGQPSMRRVYGQMTTNNAELYLRRGTQTPKPYFRVHTNHNIEDFEIKNTSHPNLENCKVIRWGNRIDATTNGGTVVYNSAKAIKNSTQKELARQIFIEKGVRTPQLFEGLNPPDSFPVIARPVTHSKGKDFVVLNTLAEFKKHYKEHEYLGWYYSEFIDKDREFRVYTAHGKVLGVNEKPRPEDKTQLAWNQAISHDKWKLLKWADYPHDVVLEACKATQALGLDFAGVDVVLKGKKAYVLESNTAPTVSDSPMVSLKFAKYFDWLNRKDTRREHWDFTQWKKAESFAWKELQLLETQNKQEA